MCLGGGHQSKDLHVIQTYPNTNSLCILMVTSHKEGQGQWLLPLSSCHLLQPKYQEEQNVPVYFSVTVPPSTLLYSPLLLSRIFISTPYLPSSAWEAQMGECDLFAREQHPSLLYLKSYISISFLIKSLLALVLPTLLVSLLLYQDISSCLNTLCNCNFFHQKKIE